MVEDDLSQSLKNGYLLLEDEIDHVRISSIVVFFRIFRNETNSCLVGTRLVDILGLAYRLLEAKVLIKI